MSPDSQQFAGDTRPETSPVARLLTVAVCALAMLVAVTAIEADTESRLGFLVRAGGAALAVLVGGVIGGAVRLKRVADSAAAAVFLAYVLNGLAEPVVRLCGYGRALELVLFEGLLATLPVFAFAARVRNWVPLAGTASLFAVLFAVCLLATPTVGILAAGWTLLATVWLMAIVRERQSGEQLGQVSSTPLWVVVVPIAIIALVIAATASGRDSLSLSSGFLASSGGDGDASEWARDGVGDGDALVAATTQPESFGPIEDAPFAQSHDPSLYDLFDDTYGEMQPIKKTDQAISLAPEDVLSGDRHLAEAESAGREFSTLRKPRKGRRGGVGDIDSAAMFYVAGRVPLHLRMQVLENFDGIVWTENPPRENHIPEVEFDVVDGKPWLVIPQPTTSFDELLSEPEAHAIKPVHFDATRIPTPPNATAVHIDQVDKASLFGWAQEDIVEMKRKRLAKLVPIHIASRRIDFGQIDEFVGAVAVGGRHELHAVPQHAQMDAIRNLASEWTAGTERGWSQVEQVIRRLREHAVVDRETVASAESDFPVAEFLFKTRRGPDYQFATAACLMLRSLGYSTRVVAGFYANPEKYDTKGRHTSVDGEDVHTWCEVRLGGKCWATVEPTPGYVVLAPPRSLWYRIKTGVAEFARAAANQWPFGLVALTIGLAAWFWRVELRDSLRAAKLAWTSRGESSHETWRLIEQRLDAVYPAPPGRTPRKRIDNLPAPAEVKSLLCELVSQAESNAYSGETLISAASEDASLPSQCRRRVTLRELRQWSRPKTQKNSVEPRSVA